MKKALVVLLCGALLCTMGLAACGSTPSTPETPTQEPVTTPPVSGGSGTSDTPMLGGWTVNTDFNAYLSEEDQATFNQAMEGLVGANYVPVSVLATQVVAGTNLAYLAQETAVTPEAQPEWAVVVVYRNLEGGAEVTSVEKINLADIKTLDNVDTEHVVGGWTVSEPGGKPLMLPTEEAQTAFDQAAAEYVGVDLKPIVLLGTQVVAGMNYKLLCYGTTVTENPVSALYVVDVYADLEGKSEISSVQVFDLLSYIR